MLMAAYESNNLASTYTMGKERETFINLFLSNVLPRQFRFGSGEITDIGGNLSGQVDIVIEYSIFPSLQLPGAGLETRLYLAEGVAAAFEVKSNLAEKWEDVKKAAQKIKRLKRRFGGSMGLPPPFIPVIAVGYTGWSTMNTLKGKIEEGFELEGIEEKYVDGILIIDKGLFVWRQNMFSIPQISHAFEGPQALWGLISALHLLAKSLQSSSLDIAFYGSPELAILGGLCSWVNGDFTEEINFNNFARRAHLDKQEQERIISILQEKGLIQIVSNEIQTEGEERILKIKIIENDETKGASQYFSAIV